MVQPIALVALALAAPAGDRPTSDEQLLERHRPLLRYDADEEHFAQPANHPPRVTRVEKDLVHGHVAHQDGERWLQYWLFFSHNTQDRGILGTGWHEGDWEVVQVGLGKDDDADSVTFSQHSSAESCAIEDVKVERGAPVAYVANGSHALYPHAGTADRPFPDPNDEADGAGRSVRPAVVGDRGEWTTYEGLWGSSRAGIVPGEQSSPPGPPFQESGAWQNPATYAASARPCGSGPPGRWWALPALALALGGLGAAAFLLLRRLRR